MGSQLEFPTVTAASLPSGIDSVKVADGSVANAEFQRLDGVTSAIQTQLDAKAALNAPATGYWLVPEFTQSTTGRYTIATNIPVTATGRYVIYFELTSLFSSAPYPLSFTCEFNLASSTYAGVAARYNTADAGFALPASVTFGIASGLVVIDIQQSSLGTTKIWAVAFTDAAAATAAHYTGWTSTNGGVSATATATISNGFNNIRANAIAMAGALSGATTGAFSSTITAGGDVILTGGSLQTIRTNTSDAADSKCLSLNGGGAANDGNRGAFINLAGNEFSGAGGQVYISAGNITGGFIDFIPGGAGVSGLRLLRDLSVTLHATTAASFATALGVSGVGAQVIRATALNINATNVKITWSSAFYDSSSFWSGGSATRLTIPSTGVYLIQFEASYLNISAGGRITFSLYKNGTVITNSKTASSAEDAGASVRNSISLTWIVSLTAADYIEIDGNSSGNHDIKLPTGNDASCRASIVKI